MIAILKNNLRRTLVEKGNLIFSFILLIIAVISAIYISDKAQIRGNIAIVGLENKEIVRENKYLNVEYVNEYPKKSTLVRGIYDAIISIDKTNTNTTSDTGSDIESGIESDIESNIKIETFKDEDFKNKIRWIISNPNSVPEEEATVKKVGSNILGFMLLFILFQGLTFGNHIAIDKEKHIIERISTTPIGFKSYIIGNMVFSFLMLFVQMFFVLSMASLFGMNIGFTLLQYIPLISLIILVAISISSILNSIFKLSDSYLMIGSSLITLTTILTGSFSNFAKHENIFHKILYIFPQKDLIKFFDAVERNNFTTNNKLQLAYIVLFIVVGTTFSIFKMKRDHEYKK